MPQNSTHCKLRISVLTVALLGVYEGAGAQAVTVNNGQTVTIPSDGEPVPAEISKIVVRNGGVLFTSQADINGNASGSNTGAVQVNGTATLTGGSITNGSMGGAGDHHGLIVEGDGATATANGVTFTTTGAGGKQDRSGAVTAKNGAVITLAEQSVVNAMDDGAESYTHGLFASGGLITANDVAITAKGDGDAAVYLWGDKDRATRVDLTDTTIESRGDGIDAVDSEVNAERFSITAHEGYGVLARDGSRISLTNGIIDTADAAGIYVRSVGSEVTGTNVSINTTGGHSDWGGTLLARNGGSIALTDSTLTTSANGVHGINARDDGTITLGKAVQGSSISVSGEGTWAVHAESGASIGLSGTTLTNTNQAEATAGSLGGGVFGHGVNTRITLDQGSTVTVAGSGSSTTYMSMGVKAQDGAHISLGGGSVAATGSRFTRGLYAQNDTAGGSSIEATNVAVSTTGNNSHAVHADGGTDPSLDPAGIQLTGGTVHTSGEDSSGLYSQRGGEIISSAIVTTEGRASFGAFAYGGGDITLDGGEIHTSGGATTSGANAFGTFGVLSKRSSDIAVNNTSVTTTGDLAEGLRAEHDASEGSRITVQGSSISTSGSQAHGIGVMGSGSFVSVSDSTIVASATDASGAQLTDKASLVLHNVAVESGGASFSSVMTQAGQTQNITVAGTSVVMDNNGTLLNVSRLPDAGDGDITLVLGSGARASGDIIDGDIALVNRTGRVAFTLGDGASWTGALRGLDAATIGQNAVFKETGGQFETSQLLVGDGATVHFTQGVKLNQAFTAKGGTQALFGDGSTITNGVVVSGSNSELVGEGTFISTATKRAAAKVDSGGTLQLTGGSVSNTNTALSSAGVQAIGVGTQFIGKGVAISTAGVSPASSELSNALAASDHAEVNLVGGSVASLGASFGRAILVTTSATLDAQDVAISTAGTMSNAVHAFSNRKVESSAEDTPTITLRGGTVTTVEHDSYGLVAQNIGSVIHASGVAISTAGPDSIGAVAYNGARLDLDDVQIGTAQDRSHGISLNATSTEQQPSGPPVPSASNLGLASSIVNTTGDGSHGVFATLGSTAQIDNTAISVTGVDAFGVRIEGGSKFNISGGSVSAIGDDFGGGLYATGDGSSIDATDLNIVVERSRVDSINKPIGVGIEAVRGGEVKLTRGSITTRHDWNDGILAYRAAASASGTAIQTNGLASTGVKAWREVSGYPSVTASVALTGGTVRTLGDESYGLLAQNDGSTITASGTQVSTAGMHSYGANAYNGGALALTNVNVRTAGGEAHGLVMGGMSDTMRPGSDGRVPTVASTIAMTGGSVVATGSGASGVYLEDSGSVTLTGVRVESDSASIWSRFEQADQTQSITVGSGSNVSVNNGTLLLVERSGDGIDGEVTLTLKSGSYATGNVVSWNGDSDQLGDGSGTRIIREAGAHWAGLVLDSRTREVQDNETYTDETFEGDVAGSAGSNVVFTGGTFQQSVASGGNSTVAFSGNTTITGRALGQSGSTMSFGGGNTTISGGVIGVGSSFQFSGPTTTINNGLAGSGSNFVFGGGTTTITGGVQLDDSATLQGGTSGAPIQITGDVGVNSGATLGGNLNVDGALSGDGGILGPGNSIGIQTYDALTDFTGTYIAEVDAAGRSDLIKIETGNADLNTLALRVGQASGNGGYLLNHDYTIIKTVTGNIENQFSSIGLDSSLANTLAQLDPIKYGTQDVKISLSLNTAKVAAQNFTGNRSSVMSGLQGHPSLMGVVATMQVDDVSNALNQLSGEVHGSTQSALHSSGGLLVSTIGNRMRGNVGAGMLAGAPTADASGSAVAGSMPRSAAYPLWAEVVGNWNTLDGDDNAAETKSHTAGIYVGGDTAVGNGWRVGGALGFTDGRIKADAVGSRSDVRSYTATVYGGNQWAAGNGQVNFLAGAGYTRHNIDSRRSINVGGSQTLKADYDANTVQLFTELGYAMPVGQVSTIEPYAGVAWSSQRTKDFTETGGSAALHGKGQTDDVTTLTLGLRGTTLMAVGQHDARLSAGLGWRHASGDVNANRTMSFVQGGGAAFTVAGAPIAKNAAVVDLGAEVDVGKNAAMGLAYSGQFGNGSTDSTGSLYLKVRF